MIRSSNVALHPARPARHSFSAFCGRDRPQQRLQRIGPLSERGAREHLFPQVGHLPSRLPADPSRTRSPTTGSPEVSHLERLFTPLLEDFEEYEIGVFGCIALMPRVCKTNVQWQLRLSSTTSPPSSSDSFGFTLISRSSSVVLASSRGAKTMVVSATWRFARHAAISSPLFFAGSMELLAVDDDAHARFPMPRNLDNPGLSFANGRG